MLAAELRSRTAHFCERVEAFGDGRRHVDEDTSADRLFALDDECQHLYAARRALRDGTDQLRTMLDASPVAPHAARAIGLRAWSMTEDTVADVSKRLDEARARLDAARIALYPAARAGLRSLSPERSFDCTGRFEQPGHTGITHASPAGDRVFLSAGAPHILALDPESGGLERVDFGLRDRDVVWGTAFDPDAQRLIALVGDAASGKAHIEVLHGRAASPRLRESLRAVDGPRGISTGTGAIAFADESRRVVRVLDEDGASVCEVGPGRDLDCSLRSPSSTGFDAQGHLFVADLETDLVYLVDPLRREILAIADGIARGSRIKIGAVVGDRFLAPSAAHDLLLEVSRDGDDRVIGRLPTRHANGVCVFDDRLYAFDDEGFRIHQFPIEALLETSRRRRKSAQPSVNAESHA